jgi:hypothetical protein
VNVNDPIPSHHPVTLREQWHKVAAAIMVKLGVERVVLTDVDVAALARPGGIHIVARETGDALVIMLVSNAELERLTREAGALPA